MSMKAVVNAVSSVTDDVKGFERNPTRFEIGDETVRHLRERCEATLQNLVSAARNHASSFGLSPVSLMDAAASHVSAAIIDLVKLLYLRRASSLDRERDARSPDYGPIGGGNSSPAHGYKPSLRSVDEIRTKSPHARAPSSGSTTRLKEEEFMRNISGTTVASSAMSPQQPSPRSLEDAGTVVGGISDDSATVAGADNSWAELKVSRACQDFEMF